MKKLKYNITDKYTGVKYNPEGISKDEGYNCLSMCLDFCKNEFDMPYTFEDKITGDLSWENITELFKDKPQEVFKELEKHFTNYYKMILPHQMRKGDVVIINNGDIKMPCIYVGGNKILVTRKERASIRLKDSDDAPISIKDGIKVVDLKGLNIHQVYRVKEKRKITTKAVYKLGDNPEDFKLLEEESYIYDGDIAECWVDVAYLVIAIISLIISIWTYFNMPDPPKDTDVGSQVNTRSTKEPLKVVYGLQRVGGNDVFMHTSGTYHRDLYIIQTLSEGECEGIEDVDGVKQIFINDHLPSYFSGLMSYQFYTGSSTQTYDTIINGIKSDYTDNMRHTSYIRWYFKHDKDKYVMGKPTRLLNLKGRKLYDYRVPPSAAAWSQNGVLALYDWFTNERYGLGIPTEYIDITSWTTAANYFDNKGWLFNYISSGSKNPWATSQDIMAHFRGVISWFDGKYYLLISDLNEESSVMVIEDKHIVQGSDGKAEITLVQPNRFNKPKGIKVKFLDKEKSYTEDEILIGEEFGVVKTTSYLGYTDRKTACDLATYELERARLNRTISGTFRDDCLELAPHNLITFNSTALAIADQPMRVVSTSYAGNGLINLSLQYESEELYDDDYDAEIEGVYTCTLPNPNVVIIIENPSISEETYYYSLRTESRLNISFTVPEEATWFDHCEVWQAITSAGAIPPSDSEYTHQFNTTNDFTLSDNIEKNKKYYIRLVSVSIFGVKNTFDNSPSLVHTVLGNSNAPQSLAYLSAIPSNNSLSLFSDKLNDPDIENYEFRIGMADTGDTTWSTSLLLTSKRAPLEQLSQVKPGEHHFYCNTKGTNGLYGITPVDATAKVYLPIGWGLNTTFTDDYTDSPSGSTFNNTEHTTYSSDDYLQCSHSGSTSGSYFTRTFDTSAAAADYYVYWDAWVYVIETDNTWNSVMPSGNDWDSINISELSWNEIFEVESAPEIDVTVQYSVDNVDWYEMKNAEMLSAIINARYFKVKIIIKDPSSEIYAQIQHFELKLYTKT